MYIICDICNKEFEENHICNKDDVRKIIKDLELKSSKSDKIKDLVLDLLKDLDLKKEKVLVDTKLLKKLWNVCEFEDNVELFVAKWLCLHTILSTSFRLFKYKDGATFLDKLKDLEENCVNAKKVFGYDSNFDLSAEDILNQS